MDLSAVDTIGQVARLHRESAEAARTSFDHRYKYVTERELVTLADDSSYFKNKDLGVVRQPNDLTRAHRDQLADIAERLRHVAVDERTPTTIRQMALDGVELIAAERPAALAIGEMHTVQGRVDWYRRMLETNRGLSELSIAAQQHATDVAAALGTGTQDEIRASINAQRAGIDAVAGNIVDSPNATLRTLVELELAPPVPEPAATEVATATTRGGSLVQRLMHGVGVRGAVAGAGAAGVIEGVAGVARLLV